MRSIVGGSRGQSADWFGTTQMFMGAVSAFYFSANQQNFEDAIEGLLRRVADLLGCVRMTVVISSPQLSYGLRLILEDQEHITRGKYHYYAIRICDEEIATLWRPEKITADVSGGQWPTLLVKAREPVGYITILASARGNGLNDEQLSVFDCARQLISLALAGLPTNE